jgi:hypothetical protein
MSYIEKNLMSGEVIVYRATLHWTIYEPTIRHLTRAAQQLRLTGGHCSKLDPKLLVKCEP